MTNMFLPVFAKDYIKIQELALREKQYNALRNGMTII